MINNINSMFNMFGTNQVKNSKKKDSFFKEFGMDIHPQSIPNSQKKDITEDY